MLTTFTTEHGLLVIRAEDLRRIQDQKRTEWGDNSGSPISLTVCIVEWTPNSTDLCRADVLGTAQENLDRILEAETKALATYEAMQRRQSQGLPVVRGGKGAQG